MNGEQRTYFGVRDRHQPDNVVGITEADRLRHLYIIGRTGVGKSTLLEHIALQDIYAGGGLAFIDPHGQSAERLLELIPSDRIRDVVYFNPYDVDRPISLNLLDNVQSKSDLASTVAQGVVGALHSIWADSWGPRMDRIFYNAVAALLEYGHGTLLGVLRMLTDREYRKYVISYVKDPILYAFWAHEFEGYRKQLKDDSILPILNKVERFLSNSQMRNIFAQKKNRIDFDVILDQRQIFIANLSKGRIGELNSNLLGSLLTTGIELAVMRRDMLREEVFAGQERLFAEEKVTEAEFDAAQELFRQDLPTFPLIIDEFQSFSTQSFHSILSESRKFGLSLTIAHQYMGQLDKIDKTLRAAILGNAATLIAFRISAADAQALEDEFSPWPRQSLVDLDMFTALIKPTLYGEVYEPFHLYTFPPVKPATKEAGEKRKQSIINHSRRNYGIPRAIIERKVNASFSDRERVTVRDASKVAPKVDEAQRFHQRKNRG